MLAPPRPSERRGAEVPAPPRHSRRRRAELPVPGSSRMRWCGVAGGTGAEREEGADLPWPVGCRGEERISREDELRKIIDNQG